MAAEKGNKYAEGNKGGAPSLYKPEYNKQVYKLCLLGATDKEIADFFNVCEATINNWKTEHEEFLESIREGKEIADMEVAASLYESTKDRAVKEVKAIKLKEVFWVEGKRHERETVQLVDEERVIPADYRSQSLWLRNRRGDKWRDKQEVDHTSKGQPIQYINLGDGEPESEE